MSDKIQDSVHSAGKRDGVTLRSVLIGLALVPVNVYLVVQWETVWTTQYPTTMGIFFNAIFCLLLIIVINFSLRKLLPKKALSQGELLTIYTVLMMATSVSGHDFSQSIYGSLGTARWFATPENEWASLFWKDIPGWLTVSDKKVLDGFYEGQSTLYLSNHIKGWLTPLIWWTVFLTVLSFVMVCMNSIVRKQWIEREKLTYPLVQLPFEMTQEDAINRFFKNRLLWLGFGIATGVNIINGLGFLYSAFPSIPLRYDLGAHLIEKPWNAIGGGFAQGKLPVQVNPYAIGLAFPIPLDLLFSCWFLFLVWQAERVMGSALGVNTPGYPFNDQQILGAYLGIAAVAIWMGRRPLWRIVKGIVVSSSDSDDSEEPMKYRNALLGMFLGIIFLIAFSYKAGMSIWFATFFFLMYLVIILAFTRMRAELGPPLQGLWQFGPIQFMVSAMGSRRLSRQTLVVSAQYWALTKQIRNSPAQCQLESFKLAERASMDTKKLWKVMILTIFIALAVTFWAFLQANYKWGGVGAYRGVRAYSAIERWLISSSEPDVRSIGAVAFGFAFVLVNTMLRLRFLWWYLHPLGYPLAGYWQFDRLWFPFFIAWGIKWTILKYGGIKLYRKAFPFFMGLVLGAFVVGSLWGILGLLTGKPTYAFKEW